jgi:arylsulfatase A-like enzyme
MVEHMDRRIGDILKTIDRIGAESNTFVIFQSDNGGYNLSRNLPLRGTKSSCWEGGIRVPSMMRWPGVFVVSGRTQLIASGGGPSGRVGVASG